MKVLETKVKEFQPYKVSIKTQGEKFVLEYYIRRTLIGFGEADDIPVHQEEFDTLEEATLKFCEVIGEIDESKRIN